MVAIRGISDIVGLERDRKWTEYACHTAGAFVRAFIVSGPVVPRASSAKVESRRSLLDLFRQIDSNPRGVWRASPVSRAPALYRDILEKWSAASVSQLLSASLLLAYELGNTEFEKWVRLELDGYFRGNKALTDDVVVPEYRAVPVRYIDPMGGVIVIRQERLSFLTEYRLRHGAAELEKMMSISSEVLRARDPWSSEFFMENFRVEVDLIEINPLAISGVLSAIKTRLLDWLREFKSDVG
jgi:hypothetical protein